MRSTSTSILHDSRPAQWLSNLTGGHVLLVAIVLVLLRAFYLISLHPLRRVPGPWLARVTGLWRTRRYALGNWHGDIVRLHRRYGPVVRVAPNEVSFVDKDALVRIYGHTTGTRKTSWYDVWEQPGASTGFFAATDPKEHAFLRKRVSGAYSMSTILGLEPEIDKICKITWNKLDELATRSVPVNIQQWTGYFAFDVVSSLGMGAPLGFVQQGIDVKGIIKSIHDMFYISAIMGDIPGQLVYFRNPIWRAMSRLLGDSSLNAGENFQTWLWGQIRARAEETKNADRRPDMLDHFLSMKEADGSKVGLPGVVIEAGNLVGAGADTTAAGMSSVLGELFRHPEDYAKVQGEVDEVYASGIIQPGDCIDYKTAEKLPWLSACAKEALRLTPSIVWQLPRHAPDEGVTIADHYIPRSVIVSMIPYAANRDEKIFGSDACEWNPARYVVGSSDDVTAEYVRNIEKFNMTFGYGSRTCIGRNLALVEIYRFLAEFCHRYDVEPVTPKSPYWTFSQWFVVHKDFQVVLRRRKGGEMGISNGSS